MEVHDLDELARLTKRMAAAMESGREAEHIIESMLGLDAGPQSSSGGAFDDARLLRLTEQRHMIGISPDQLSKARHSLAEFVAAMRPMPAEVDLASVGHVAVLTPATQAAMPTWDRRMSSSGSRAEIMAELSSVKNELTWALADLQRLRLRIGLAKVRLEKFAD